MKIKRINKNAILPTRGSACAAGYDLHACSEEDITIAPGETAMISSGVALKIPEGFFGAIYARSGMATKRGLRPANCVGVVDSDYTGEVFVPLHNDSNEPQIIHNEDRIAQIIFQPFAVVKTFEEVDELEETERGDGGFGSTGTSKIIMPNITRG